MSLSPKNKSNSPVSREVFRPSATPTETTEFRSWREQADYQSPSLSASKASAPSKHHYRNSPLVNFLRSRDFHVMVAITSAIAIAYAAFRFLGGGS